MNYRLKIQYDGTRYRGWQRQEDAGMTIQGKLEHVLSEFAGQEIRIDGAGRTDAGVHALEQVANVHFPERMAAEPQSLKEYLNRYLPEDIRILSVERAGERFHSRLNASGKVYRYHILKWDAECVFVRKYVWRAPAPLDAERMRRAAEYLTGTHDFRSFCTKASKKKSTIRTIHAVDIEETETEIRLTFCGSGFLYNMVRILTGTLAEVGMGEREPEELPRIMSEQDRRCAGQTAPPNGLFLVKVLYD